MNHPSGPGDLGWLLNDFADRVPKVAHIIAVSSDGLMIARSRNLPEDRADQMAAVASGLVGLLAGAARLLQAEPVVSTLVELNGGFMFQMAVSSGASLLVLADRECDIGQVSYEMAELINRVGPALTPVDRSPLVADPDAAPAGQVFLRGAAIGGADGTGRD